MQATTIFVGIWLIGVATCSCPSGCNCNASRKEVVCSGRTSIPTALPAGTTSLVMEHCNIDTIDPLAFYHFSGITKISLAHNKLKKIEVSSLLGLSVLKSLDLSHNSLEAIEMGAFSSMVKLTSLDLSNNHLSAIQTHHFSGLVALTDLNLAHNEIKNLPNGVFNEMSKLQKLNLSKNKIKSISFNAFSSLAKVTTLDLSFNSLSLVLGPAFRQLTGLKELLLNDNVIGVMPIHLVSGTLEKLSLKNNMIKNYGKSLDKLTALAHLDLSYNKLDTFLADFDMKTLKVLNLGDNSIVAIDKAHFKRVPKLRELHIKNNKLVTLHESLKPFVDKMTLIDLENNLFHCNCEVLWLKRSTATKIVYPLCKFPSANEQMDQVDDSRIVCVSPKFVLDSTFIRTTATGMTVKCSAKGDPAPRIEWIRFSISHDPSTHFKCPTCYSGYPGGAHRCYCTTGKGTSVPQLYLKSTVLDKAPPADKSIMQNSAEIQVPSAKMSNFGYQCKASNDLGEKRIYFAVEDYK